MDFDDDYDLDVDEVTDPGTADGGSAGSKLTYRVSSTLDPEDRLEDAAMAKAMSDAFGGRLEITSEGSSDFGRDRYFEGQRENIRYWDDPAFLKHAGREFYLCDVEEAEKRIKDLHDRGKGAFVKAIDLKLFALPVPVGTSLSKALDAYIFSVIDRPPCIMVQEACSVEWEQRFVVVDRKVVAKSPVATHLTPISRLPDGAFFKTPQSKDFEICPVRDLEWLAAEAAVECQKENLIIDCALFDGRPAVIEFNPFSIGNFGLYACDPHAIAQAFAGHFDKTTA